MSQNRPPPAYQEYAAAMLADIRFRTMSLAERGLLHTMRLECWVNSNLPKDPATLAKILGADAQEIAAMLPAVMGFFAIQDDLIICPELEKYRTHLASIREKQAQGGKHGAALTNRKRRPAKTTAVQGDSANPASNPRDPRPTTRDSLVNFNSIQPSQNQSLKKGDLEKHREWLDEHARYEKASNG